MKKNGNLAGKRLLILGHPVGTEDIVKYANECGVYTIVADWFETSPAKEIANESFLISTTDIDSLTDLAKNKKVDAVTGGISDFNFGVALEISERLGLPFYANRKQWELTSNKRQFKQLCRTFNIPVIPEFRIDGSFSQEQIEKVVFPVFVKPVDSAASKGTSVCKNIDELKLAYQNAVSHSPSKSVLVEKYIENMRDINLFYTVQNGEYSIAAMCDRYLTYEQGEKYAPLPIAYIFPSLHLNSFISKHHDNIVSMCKSIGIENGRFDFCGFTNGEEFYFYEMSYRLGGTQEWILTEHVNGINALKLMVNHALTGEMGTVKASELNKPEFHKPCCELKYPLKPGIIGRVVGIEDISKMPGVIKIHFRRKLGDNIVLTGSLHQIFLGVHICADDYNQLSELIRKVNDLLVIKSNTGEDMRMERFYYSSDNL